MMPLAEGVLSTGHHKKRLHLFVGSLEFLGRWSNLVQCRLLLLPSPAAASVQWLHINTQAHVNTGCLMAEKQVHRRRHQTYWSWRPTTAAKAPVSQVTRSSSSQTLAKQRPTSGPTAGRPAWLLILPVVHR